MIGDNLASHISFDVIAECDRHNINFVLLPPNSTHLTQPLDVAVFRGMKMRWRNVLGAHKSKRPGCLAKEDFPKLLKELICESESAVPALWTESAIRAGFKKCGISPLNREKVLAMLPREPQAGEPRDVEDSFVEFLRMSRFTESGSTRARKKRINVKAGRSVTARDFSQSDSDSDDTAVTSDSDEAMEEQGPAESLSDVDSSCQPDAATGSSGAGGQSVVERVEREELAYGDFLVVKVPTTGRSRTRGPAFKVYVAKLINTATLTVKFLRQQEGGKFKFPQQDDVSDVLLRDIIGRVNATERRGVYTIPGDVMTDALNMVDK